MKNGLKQKLNDWLKSENGRLVSINAIEQQVRLWGYKISNYERRLRPSESPNVASIKKDGAIVGYYWTHKSYVMPVDSISADEFLKRFSTQEVKTSNTLF